MDDMADKPTPADSGESQASVNSSQMPEEQMQAEKTPEASSFGVPVADNQATPAAPTQTEGEEKKPSKNWLLLLFIFVLLVLVGAGAYYYFFMLGK